MSVQDYEERREARRDRLEGAAERAQAQSDSAFKRARGAVAGIPFGQPILVGHHSERRHRRDLTRSDAAMRRGVEASRRAGELRSRAAGVGRGGISSDDPEAVAKLRVKLADMLDRRDQAKLTNRQFRKGGWDNVEAISEGTRENCKRTMAQCPWIKKPFPSYYFSNLSGNIRRVRQRIEELEAAETAPEREPIEGEGFSVFEDRDENRVCVEFPERISREGCQRMRSAGFRWNRRLTAWTRLLKPGVMEWGEAAAAQAVTL